MKCNICDGYYPESKHNFEQCYSLDVEWGVKQICIDKYAVDIQSWYRGSIFRNKLINVGGVTLLTVKDMLLNYKRYIEKSLDIEKRCNLSHKKIRMLNFPMEISENIVRFVINRKYKYIKCIWDIKSGDLLIPLNGVNYRVEVKAFSSTGPSSFGPTESWDRIYFIDCTQNSILEFKIYEIRLSNTNSIWKNIKVNKTETYYDQCIKKKKTPYLLPCVDKTTTTKHVFNYF